MTIQRKTPPNKKTIEIINQCEYRNKIKYSFSINPNDEHQWFGCCDRIRKTQSYVILRLKNLIPEDVAKWQLYPEISMPQWKPDTKGPRIHYHGYITFNDSVQFLSDCFYVLSQLFNFKIDYINDEAYYKWYTTKDKDVFKPKWNKLELEYPITNESESKFLYLLNNSSLSRYNSKDKKLIQSIPLTEHLDTISTRKSILSYT